MSFCKANSEARRVCPGQIVVLDTGPVAQKSAEFLLHVLTNAEQSVELKGLGVEPLVIGHAQVGKAPKRNCQTLESMHVMQELPMPHREGTNCSYGRRGVCTEERETPTKKQKEQRF